MQIRQAQLRATAMRMWWWERQQLRQSQAMNYKCIYAGIPKIKIELCWRWAEVKAHKKPGISQPEFCQQFASSFHWENCFSSELICKSCRLLLCASQQSLCWIFTWVFLCLIYIKKRQHNKMKMQKSSKIALSRMKL